MHKRARGQKKWDLLVCLGEVVPRLGEPLRLSEGRLRLGKPANV